MDYPLNECGGWIVPPNARIKDGTTIPDYSQLGNWCKLGNECTLGNWCKLGDWCKLGKECTLGNECTLGKECTLGNECTLGDECKWLGVIVSAWLTISNVDGSGRQVKCVLGKCGTKMVEAGCWRGTVEAFVARARNEGRHTYAAVIPAVFDAIKGGE